MSDHFGATEDEVIESLNEDVANLNAQLRAARAEADELREELKGQRVAVAWLETERARYREALNDIEVANSVAEARQIAARALEGEK